MIPDYQTAMLPILKSLKDGKIKEAKEIQNLMISIFKITDEEKRIKIPSGDQPLFYNRIAWAITHLKRSETIIAPIRGNYQITDLGRKILKNPPEKITVKYLKDNTNFNKNLNINAQAGNKIESDEGNEEIDKTPDELINIGISQISIELSKMLLSQIKDCSAYFFEQIVVDLLLKMGYGGSLVENGEVTAKSGDEGIDGIIKEDKLGLDKIYIQAKKWEGSVSRPEIQKFVGALQGQKAKKGIFITTSLFTKEAIEYAKNLELTVILIDGNKLTDLMIEYEVGVSVKKVFKIKRLDTDYFNEEAG